MKQIESQASGFMLLKKKKVCVHSDGQQKLEVEEK